MEIYGIGTDIIIINNFIKKKDNYINKKIIIHKISF